MHTRARRCAESIVAKPRSRALAHQPRRCAPALPPGLPAARLTENLHGESLMRRTALALALALMPMNAFGQNFDTGLSAYLAGDYATALQEWRPLAEQGDADAQNILGTMYGSGRGVPQDSAEAVRLYRLAAEQGNGGAQYNLANAYATGRGVPQDGAKAVRLYRKLAEQGKAFAQYSLGNMYRTGQGVLQDYTTAHMWFNIAAANGADVAAENRDVVANLMTAADISEAQRRARVCMESNYCDCN